MEELSSKPLCLVTGGAGFIGSHIILQLRQQGIPCRATVRKIDREDEKTIWLINQGCELVEADLTSSKGWEDAVKGAEFVFHVASPFKLNVTDGQKELVTPAVNGTRCVLEACLKSSTLRRVVLTSSIAAIAPEGEKNRTEVSAEFSENGWTEQAWNTLATVKEHPYPRSKVEAEQFAWFFVGANKNHCKWDLVTVNPSAVFGPILVPVKDDSGINTSNQFISKVLQKEYPGYPKVEFPSVDVRDVAKLSLTVAFNPKAAGRYICHQGPLKMSAVGQFLHEAFPGLKGLIPDSSKEIPNSIALFASLFDRSISFKAAWNFIGEPAPRFDNSKAIKEFDFKYRETLKDAIVDTALSLAEFPGVLKDPKVVQALIKKA